jgi:hypothetical protein
MMYRNFKKKFVLSEKLDKKGNEDIYQNLPSELLLLFTEIGGNSFDNGLYKTHSVATSLRWAIMISNYFDNYKGLIYPFGYDWMGRHFCLSTKDRNKIFMFDPATKEDFVLEQDLINFHNYDLVDDREAMLSESTFKTVLSSLSLEKIGYDDCLGYKVPLFLNGNDSIENYEKVDLEVYWDILKQLYNQIKDLPAGTPISSIRIERNPEK